MNTLKSKNMVVNFTRKYQFGTRLLIEGTNIEVVRSAKILGTIISDDLSWDLNCAELVRKANARMALLRKMAEFGASEADKKTVYIVFLRSLLEQSAVVWSSSLNLENIEDLERCQKNSIRLIDTQYESYEVSLTRLKLIWLQERRKLISYKFAKKCISHPKIKDVFPINTTEQ